MADRADGTLVTLLANRLIEANPSLSASAVSPPGANGNNGVVVDGNPKEFRPLSVYDEVKVA